jgi:hypothetical protein
MAWNDVDIKMEELVGVTLKSIVVSEAKDEILFTTDNDLELKMYHSQDCCEGVSIEDICGDLDDLIGSPLTMCEEVGYTGAHNTDWDKEKGPGRVTVENGEWPEGVPLPEEYGDESYTWTFYKFATIKGSVTIRWYGSSNGYYSESVSFIDVYATKQKELED